MDVTFSGAKTGSGKYVSCVLSDSNGDVLFYGKLSAAASGTANFAVPPLENGDYEIQLFNEQVGGSNNTDFCSEPVVLPLTVYDSPASLKIGLNLSGTEVYFGEYKPVTLTAGAKDIYVVVEDANGLVSDPLKIEAVAYVTPVYAIAVDPTEKTFSGATVGYDNTAMAQTFTVTSTGNATVTGMQTSLAGSDFEICETLPSSNLSPGDNHSLSCWRCSAVSADKSPHSAIIRIRKRTRRLSGPIWNGCGANAELAGFRG